MKKIFLTLAVVAISFSVMAQQMPMCSSSPFFAAKDVKATKDVTPEWHQISQDVTGVNFLDPTQTISTADIRNAGKAMVIDFSATWCSWCWVMHTNGILEGIADEFGDDIEVLWVEADPSTNADGITGSGNSQGNWTQTAGGQPVPYPIIDDAAFANIIGGTSVIQGFPTVVFVSPTGYWCDLYGTDWGFGPYSASDAVEAVRVLMNSYPQPGVAPQSVSISGLSSVFAGQQYDFEVKYVSVDPVTSINWTIENGTPSTATGSTVSTSWNTTGDVTITVEVTNSIGTTTATKTINVRDGWNFGNVMDYTDGGSFLSSIGYGGNGEISWGVRYPENLLTGRNFVTNVSAYIKTAGKYDLRIYQGGTNAPQSLIYEKSFNVNVTQSWYDFHLDQSAQIDKTKNLWVTFHCNGVNYPASYCPYVGDPNTHLIDGGNGWVEIQTLAASLDNVTWMIKTTTGDVSIDGVNSTIIDIYPNPVNDKLYIRDEVAMVNVVDINGRIVISSENTNVVDMSNLSNGVYFVRVITDNGTAVKKVVKK